MDQIPYNFEDRLIEVDINTKTIRYITPSTEDLIVMKLYAERPNDLIDIQTAASEGLVDWDLLEHLVYDHDEAPAATNIKRRYEEMVGAFERYKKECKKMNLTFKGFMRSYCRELTGLETDNLRKLCAAAALNAPQAAEAIMVFAALQGKANYLSEIASNTWMHAQYQEIVQELLHYDTVDAFLESESAPERYKKVSKAYQAAKTTAAKDRRVIALMRKKTLEAMRHNGASIYSLGKTLGINKGNLYAYLSKGDVTKVSRTTARRIMDYACGL